MATIQINLNNKEYPVQCDDDQKDIIEKAATNLKTRFNELKKLSPTASNEYIMFLCALSLESDSLDGKNPSDAIENAKLKNLEETLTDILHITESLKDTINQN